MQAKRKLGRRGLVLSVAAGVIVLAVGWMISQSRSEPHVVATFVGYTDALKPERPDFAVSDLSGVQVEVLSYRKVAEAAPLYVGATAKGARSSCVVWLDFGKPVDSNTQAELGFRAPDASLEGFRE